MDYNTLKELMDEYIENEKAKFKDFKEGTLVEYKGKKGRVEYTLFNDKAGKAYVHIRSGMWTLRTRLSLWDDGGNTATVYSPDELKILPEEDFSEEIDNLLHDLWNQDSIKKREEIKKEIERICNNCTHKFEQVREKDYWDDVEVYECVYCKAKIEDVGSIERKYYPYEDGEG